MQRLVLSIVGAICSCGGWVGPNNARADGSWGNWLTDGGDAQRTSWQRHETLISPATVKNMALLWKVKLDNPPREMHNLFAPLVIGDLVVAGVTTRNRRGRRASPTTSTASMSRRARRSGSGTSIRRSMTLGGAAARSARADGRPRRLPCRRGSPASTSSTRFRGMDGCGRWIRRPVRRSRRAEPFLPAQRQALFAEHLQQRALHDDGARLRRYAQPVLRIRPGDEESRQLQSRQRRAVAASRTVDRQGRPVYAGSGDGDYLPERQIFGQAIVGVKQNPPPKRSR